MRISEGTICAPATGGGGAIAIIRVSGPDAFAIIEKIFFPRDNSIDLSKQRGYTVIFGEIRSGSELVDEVLLTVFRSPNSYTGEDSAEISCHASVYIISRIMELLIKNGGKAALPGEFTRRAFMNGKMDLSQAEAVADVIASSSKAAHKLALSQMRGVFSSEIKLLRSELLNFASLIELELDFGEEDVEFADREKLKSIIIRIKELSDQLAGSFILGNVVKNGIPVVITGKPNSGKSTLLNALLMEERAIVSEIPGTTRDVIEDTMVIEGITYRFMDTAGLRESSDKIESIGIRKAYEKIDISSVVLLIDEINEDPDEILRRIEELMKRLSGQRLFVVINKIDQADDSRKHLITGKLEKMDGSLLFISARERTGIDELKRALVSEELKNKLDSNDVIITNARHFESLTGVSESLARVLDGLENSRPEDLIAIDIRQAIHFLGEITGEISSDEILGNIFKNFCIGK